MELYSFVNEEVEIIESEWLGWTRVGVIDLRGASTSGVSCSRDPIDL